MDFLELAAKRYSVRKFSEKTVPQQMIDQILKAAHLAPTGCNNQPQRILVLQGAQALDKLRTCTTYHFYAPLVFAICYDRTKSWKRPNDGADSGSLDASIVITHMMLQACEIGIGTTCVMMFEPEKLRREFAIPEELEPVALLPAGYPAENARPSRLHDQFIPLEEMVVFL